VSHWVGEEFENNSQPILAFDSHTLEFLSVNKAAVRHLGFSAEEFSAMTLKDVLSHNDVTAIVQACAQAPSIQIPLRVGPRMLRKKDGTVMVSDVHCQSILFEGKDAIFILASHPRRRSPNKILSSGL
jgi:PAS domain-containing protein